MAKRPIFVSRTNGPPFVEEIMVEFKWIPGIAISQKKKNVASMHLVAQQMGIQPLLEISTKSQLALGKALSAFNLKLDVKNLGRISVEAAFQGSKVFQGGGPYREFYRMSGREIRKDERLRNSGSLEHFNFAGENWVLEPKTAFYDWLYLTALSQNYALSSQLLAFKGFTDIEFNPEKSFNCQARSAALYVALMRKGIFEQVMHSKSSFLNMVYSDKPSPSNPQQLSLL